MDAVIEASAAVLQNESHLSPSVLCTVFIYPPGVWVKQEPGETLNTNTHQTNRRFISKSSNPPREVTTGVSGQRVEDEVQGREFDSHGLSQRGMNQQERI